jgi:hypothetical protein
MAVDLNSVRDNLTEEELLFAEADAAALGMSLHEYMRMCIREGAERELSETVSIRVVH